MDWADTVKSGAEGVHPILNFASSGDCHIAVREDEIKLLLYKPEMFISSASLDRFYDEWLSVPTGAIGGKLCCQSDKSLTLARSRYRYV